MQKIISIFALLICVLTVNAQAIDRSIRPASAATKEIAFKDAQQFTLSNGLKVFLVEDKTTQITYYSLSLDVKPALEKDKAGLSGIFSDVFGKATRTRSKEQLNKEVDLIAAQLSLHRNGGSVSFLNKYASQALTLFSDALLNPVFSQAEFDLSLEKYKTYLSSLGDDGGDINRRVSSALTYGKDYPDGEVETLATFGNILVSDLESYYKTYFAPNVARLVIVGDVSLKDAKATAEKYFGKWQKKNVPVSKYVIPEAPKQTTVAYINKSGVAQASIDVSYPIQFSTGAPDYEAVRVLDQILGGSGSGHLFLNLRETHSYTYGIYTDIDPDELVGRFSLTSGRGAASVKTAVTDSAVFEVFNELNRIIDEPVTEKELNSAKTFLKGSFSRSLENSGTIANFALNIDKYKLPKDYYRNYLKRLEAVSAADVQAAAKKYILPKNAWVVVTGDIAYAEKLLPLAGDKTIHYYDYDANPTEAPVVKEAGVSAEKVIADYVQALGGEKAIKAINNYLFIGKINMMGQSVNIREAFKKPNYVLSEMTMNGMVLQKSIFDGTTIKISGMGGNQDLTEGEEFESSKEKAEICPELYYAEKGYPLEVSGIETINGSDAYVLKVTKSNKNVISYFDVKTGLKVKEVEISEQQVTSDIVEYKEAGGVKFPSLIKQNQGEITVDVEFTSLEVNKGVEDSIFK